MRYVLAVAETASFTRAAEKCHVVQSALSHQVARLEKELGARLFERTSRKVWLTSAGGVPARRTPGPRSGRTGPCRGGRGGRRGAGQADRGVDPHRGGRRPSAVLRDYRLRYPQVRITLRAGSSERLVEQVREGVVDAAFLGVQPGFRPQGVRDRELAHGQHVAVVAPDHPLAAEEEVDLRRLADETFVDFAEGSAARSQSDEAFAPPGCRARSPSRCPASSSCPGWSATAWASPCCPRRSRRNCTVCGAYRSLMGRYGWSASSGAVSHRHLRPPVSWLYWMNCRKGRAS